ncbi:MAG: hypothetical protein IJZ53_12340 [Tyzzerella sp.]|nr:hypothetical protein [Tyzzerella sp.]
MKNRKTTLIIVFLLLLSIPQVVSANSSWCWISETRPYDVLPVVAVATILIEVVMINRCAGLKSYYRTMACVTVANLLSFVCPYIVNYCRLIEGKGYQPISDMFEHWPVYTVGICFLIVTVAVELPIVYLGLRKRVEDTKKLKRIIVIANVLTTIMVAVVERMFCQGHW